MSDFGANPALVASPSNPQAVSTQGFDPGDGFPFGPWHIVTNKFGEHVLVETATDDNIFLLDDTESAFLYRPLEAIALLVASAPELREALIDIRNRILCPVGPAPSLDEIQEIASAALARIEARSDATENTDAAGTARAGKAPNPKVKAQ